MRERGMEDGEREGEREGGREREGEGEGNSCGGESLSCFMQLKIIFKKPNLIT